MRFKISETELPSNITVIGLGRKPSPPGQRILYSAMETNKQKNQTVLLNLKFLEIVSSREKLTYPSENIHFQESLAVTPLTSSRFNIFVYTCPFKWLFLCLPNVRLLSSVSEPSAYSLVLCSYELFYSLSPSLFLFKDFSFPFYLVTISSIFMFCSVLLPGNHNFPSYC